MKSFAELILFELINNIDNNHKDNYDYNRFGVKKNNAKESIKSSIKKFIKNKLRIKDIPLTKMSYLEALKVLAPFLVGLESFLKVLNDNNSKKILVKLITYKILGEEKVKLPLNTPGYWDGIKQMNELMKAKNSITVPFVGGKTINLYYFSLEKINIPIRIYSTSYVLYHNIIVKQYEYINDEVSIKLEEGDIVLDCGACWGDTALFFANDIGNKGHIYSFDFIPSNISVMKRNIGLNPNLKDRITIVTRPLAEVSDQELYYKDNGPASRIVNEHVKGSNMVSTISIDDFIIKNKIPKINFIKMDIEGTELPALKGGIKTIIKNKPKLAISIYHSLDDFINIPKFLNSLNIGYKFYLKHGTIHNEETVLIAISS